MNNIVYFPSLQGQPTGLLNKDHLPRLNLITSGQSVQIYATGKAASVEPNLVQPCAVSLISQQLHLFT